MTGASRSFNSWGLLTYYHFAVILLNSPWDTADISKQCAWLAYFSYLQGENANPRGSHSMPYEDGIHLYLSILCCHIRDIFTILFIKLIADMERLLQ